MTVQPPNLRGSVGGRPARQFSRLRGAMWVAATLCGGLVILLLFLATIGAIDFSANPALGVVALLMAIFWLGTVVSLARSGRKANIRRLADRERRGF